MLVLDALTWQVCGPARELAVHSGTSCRDVTRAPLVRAAGRAHRASNLGQTFSDFVFQMCLSFLLGAAAGGFGWQKLFFWKRGDPHFFFLSFCGVTNLWKKQVGR